MPDPTDNAMLVEELERLAALQENGPYVSLKTNREALRSAATALASANALNERLAGMLSRFANAIPDDRAVLDDFFPVHLGIMNGNVTQQVVRGKLRVRDFWDSRALLSDMGKGEVV